MAIKKVKRKSKRRVDKLDLFNRYSVSSLHKGRFKFMGGSYTRMLKIVIPGEPMTDSRPRVLGNIAVSVNKNKLVDLFKMMYKHDPVLNKVFITSPYAIDIVGYFSMSKVDLKLLSVFRKDFEAYKEEKLEHVDVKLYDADNMLKVHNDLFIDKVYKIAMDDAFNTKCCASKYYTPDNPRAEIVLYYNEITGDDFYSYKALKSRAYFDFLISDKYQVMHSLSDRQFRTHFYKTIELKYKEQKTVKDKQALLKSIFIGIQELSLERTESLCKTKLSDLRMYKIDHYKILIKDILEHLNIDTKLEEGEDVVDEHM